MDRGRYRGREEEHPRRDYGSSPFRSGGERRRSRPYSQSPRSRSRSPERSGLRSRAHNSQGKANRGGEGGGYTSRRYNDSRQYQKLPPQIHGRPPTDGQEAGWNEANRTEGTKEKKVQVEIHPLLMESFSPSPAPKGNTSTVPFIPQAALSSVQANIRAGRKESTLLQAETRRVKAPAPGKATTEFLATRPPDIAKKNPHFDRRLPTGPLVTHRPKKLGFVSQGIFSAEAERLRAEEELEMLRREVSESLGNIGVDTEIISDLLVGDDAEGWSCMPTDDIEWWDAPFVEIADGKDTGNVMVSLKFEAITDLIQRPALLPPPIDVETLAPPKPLMLTVEERKKLRRQRRLAEQKEKQEQVKLGLLPPEPQKTRIASIPRLLGAQSVQEPSKIEAEIRAQALARHQAHLKANQDRAEQAKQAKATNVSGLGSNEVSISVAVFRIDSVPIPQWRFKIFKNAQQHQLTGCIIYYSGFNLVIVEGGATPIRKYKHLLLDRINWKSAPADPAQEHEHDFSTNTCRLLWEGVEGKRSFWKLEYRIVENELDANEYLARFGAQHYWKLARNAAALD